MSTNPLLDRIFARLYKPASGFKFESWRIPGRPTSEALGVLAVQVDVERMVERIKDVDSYRGNIDHVLESRGVQDPAYAPPEHLRFYQRLNIPMVAEVQFENVMHDHGERDGWRVISWQLLQAETDRLNKRAGARFDYNDGAWLLREDAVGYALSSAPRKSDVGRVKFALMTKGADVTAPAVLKNNIEGMVRWAR